MILILFSFLAGIVTILSPCILPILPIILSSSVDSTGKKRPLGVVTGFVISFTFFTLFLATIVKSLGIPADTLRLFSIVVIGFFGATLLLPQFQIQMEKLFSRLGAYAPNSQNKTGFLGGFVIGLSLGLLWTPCVGPILASVITLALSGSVTGQAALITFAYALGTALPMFTIMLAGSQALRKVPWLLKNTGNIQKGFGVVMILTAIGIFFNIDRQFQAYILDTFPQYADTITRLEENDIVKDQLQPSVDKSEIQLNYDPFNYVPYSKEALTSAQQMGHTLLFFAATKWCQSCSLLEKEIQENIEKVPQGLTILKVDYDNDITTNREYSITNQHTLILLDPDGEELTRWAGGGIDELIARISPFL